MSGGMLRAVAVALLASVAPRFCDCSSNLSRATYMDYLVDKVLDRRLRASHEPHLLFQDLDSATLAKPKSLAVPTAHFSSASAHPARPGVERNLAPLNDRLRVSSRMPAYYTGNIFGSGGYTHRGIVASGSAEPLEAGQLQHGAKTHAFDKTAAALPFQKHAPHTVTVDVEGYKTYHFFDAMEGVTNFAAKTAPRPLQTAVPQRAEAEDREKGIAAEKAAVRQEENLKMLPVKVDLVHSDEELEGVLKKTPGLVVLEVVSSWCRKCKSFKPKYQRLAGDFQDVKFLKIVGNENDSTRKVVTERFNVKKIPTHYFFRDGQTVAKEEGGDEDKLRSMLSLAGA